MTTIKKQEKSIGELLIHAGFLTADKLAEALEDQKQSGEPIGKILKRKGYVKEEDILAVLKGALVLEFKISGESFAVEVVYSREILKPMKITPIHAVPDYILGIISIRGKVIPVVSLRKLIFSREEIYGKESRIVVLEHKNQSMGIVIDEITAVRNFQGRDFEKSGSINVTVSDRYIQAILKDGKNVITLLNPDALFEAGK